MQSPSLLLRLLAVTVVLMATACSSAVRGGQLKQPKSIPQSTLIASFERTHCTSRSEAQRKVMIDYVRRRDGELMLVERSSAPVWLTMTNSFLNGEYIVFQVIRSTQETVLVEYRIPRDKDRAGRYAVSRNFKLVEDSPRGFRASIIQPPETCRLKASEPQPGRRAGETVGWTDESPPSGWGYDGTSFRTGDRILVDMRGQAVVATVVQADGQRYRIQMDGASEPHQDWIDPSRIVGRLR